MEKVLHIVSSVSQPLGVAGILAAAVFFIFRQIIKKNIFPTLTKNLSAAIITLIINWLSVLALVSIVLGFAGFAMSLVYKNPVIRNPPIPQFQNVIFSGHVIDSRTARVIRGAKITVNTQDKVITDESDSKGSFVVRLHLPTDDLSVDLKVEANNYTPYFEHQVLATSPKSVALETIKPAIRKEDRLTTNQNVNVVATDRNVSGIEISFRPSPSQWSRISEAYKSIESPGSELSYSTTAMTAERIREYWVINFDPIIGPRGAFRFAQVSTDQTQNQKFEDVIKAALIPLLVKWGAGGEINLDPSEKKYPSAIKVSRDRIAFILRPPDAMLNANSLKEKPDITLRGEGEIADLTIRSLDPGVILDQNFHIDWRRESEVAAAANTTPYVAGPYPISVDLTSAPAAMNSEERPGPEGTVSESNRCHSQACGNLICVANPGHCLPCGSCGAVCCAAESSRQPNGIGDEHPALVTRLLSGLIFFLAPFFIAWMVFRLKG